VKSGIDRFLEKFDQPADSDACWEWNAYRMVLGYGVLKFFGKNRLAHRVSYFLFVGPIPDGMNVCHKCDNRGCVNPNHLFLGTQQDNIQDARIKGRMRVDQLKSFKAGEDHLNAKLKAEDVQVIKQLCLTREISQKKIAARFGVSQSAISLIAVGKNWTGEVASI
jgi:predicted XRE-type DNA-binding protein